MLSFWSRPEQIREKLLNQKVNIWSGNTRFSLKVPRDWGSHDPPPNHVKDGPVKVQLKHPICINILESNIPKYKEKSPKLSEYNGKGDPDVHVQLINERLNYLNIDESSK